MSRFSLTAVLVMSVLWCQIPGKKFFLSRIWLGTPSPSQSFLKDPLHLHKTPPALTRSETTLRRSEIVDILVIPAPALRSPEGYASSLISSAAPGTALSPPPRIYAGRSPPR